MPQPTPTLATFAAQLRFEDLPPAVVAKAEDLLVDWFASHVAEQDDVHNGSVFHPATVVFPAALAVAQAAGASGRDLLTAAVAGYEVGIRVGEFLGRSPYRVF